MPSNSTRSARVRSRKIALPLLDRLEERSLLAAGSIQFSAAVYSVLDTGGSASITLTRSGGTDGDVSVVCATSDGTATAGIGYDSLAQTVDFPDGATQEFVQIQVHSQPVASAAGKTVNIALTNPTGGASLGSPSLSVLTITHTLAAGDLVGTFGTDGQAFLPQPAHLPNGYSAGMILPNGESLSAGPSMASISPTSGGVNITQVNADGTFDTGEFLPLASQFGETLEPA